MKKPVIFLTFANDKVDDALYLRNLPLELHNIREALQPAIKAGLCEVVERTAATVDQIFDIFQDPYYQDRIAVFHYGGHANGNQLMFETLDGGHGASHSEGLVPFFGKQKGLQLVFINGCSTQQQSLEMIEVGIPAVVGTATAVKDEIATEISKRFYNGLASGLTIDQSWQQAIDTVKTKTGTKKTKGLKLRRDKSSNFPWEMHVREGSEIVKDWNLPMAVNNPLFGLPKLPNKYNLPETPYRFLQRYKEEHAEVFFGRGRYIRDLYNRASDVNAAPVILLYGQSGVGKSSMLDAGVLPRLQQENQVIYVRRDNTLGLIGTLRVALGLEPNVEETTEAPTTDAVSEEDIEEKLAPLTAILPSLDEDLKGEVENFIEKIVARRNVEEVFDVLPNRQDNSIIFQKWQALEAVEDQPLILLLDQVEEVFTKPNPDLPNELDDFFAEISLIFSNPQFKTKGKLILSYRKEYHPEIDEVCKNHQIPREHIFLKQLSKADIKEVVLGLTSTLRLQKRYELDVEEGLPEIIADDLLEDKDSPIAPVLQILLTKMWNLSIANRGENDEHHFFTTANYQELKKEGILMDDFFYQQMDKLEKMAPELVTSGLALDVLNFHTTRLGTANAQTLDGIRARYEHRQEVIDGLINKLKNLYLLTDAGLDKTGLAHDTIAPLVQENVRTSDHPGQRAFRILSNKVPTFEAFPEDTIIDTADLDLVEKGHEGMRLWTLKEEELIEVSRNRRKARRRRRAFLRMLGMVAIAVIIGLAGWANYQRGLADEQRGKADQQAEEALKQKGIAEDNADEAMRQTNIANQQKAIAFAARDSARFEREQAFKNYELALANEKLAKAETERAEENLRRVEEEKKRVSKAKELEAKQRKIADDKTNEALANLARAKAAEKIAKDETKKALALLNEANAKTQAAEASIRINEEFLAAVNEIIEAYDSLQSSFDGKSKEEIKIPSIIYQALNKANEKLTNHLNDNIYMSHPTLTSDIEMHPSSGRMAFSTFKPQRIGELFIIHNEAKGIQNRQVIPINDPIKSLDFSPDGNLLLAGTLNGKILGWDYNPKNKTYEKLNLSKDFQDLKGIIHSVSFAVPSNSSDLYYIAVGTAKNYRVYECTRSGKILDPIISKDEPNKSFLISQSGKYLTVLNDTSAHVLLKSRTTREGADKWKSYKRITISKPQKASFDKKESLIVIGNSKGVVKIYDLERLRLLLTRTIHRGPVSAIAFDEKGKKLITSSRDHTVKLYDLEFIKNPNVKLEPIDIIGHTFWVYDLAFSQDQKFIYTLSEDKTIRKWPTDIDELYKNIKRGQQKLEEQKAKGQNSN